MKKLLMTLFLVSSFAAVAGPLNILCVEAGGYYAHISVQETKDGFELKAAQGFGYSIADDLNLPESLGLHAEFSKSDCKLVSNDLLTFTCDKSEPEVLFVGFPGAGKLILDNLSLSFRQVEAELFLVTVQTKLNGLTSTVSRAFDELGQPHDYEGCTVRK